MKESSVFVYLNLPLSEIERRLGDIHTRGVAMKNGTTVAELYDGEGIAVESAPHPSRIFYTRVPFEVKEGDILRAE